MEILMDKHVTQDDKDSLKILNNLGETIEKDKNTTFKNDNIEPLDAFAELIERMEILQKKIDERINQHKS